jgi:hypothetical protein
LKDVMYKVKWKENERECVHESRDLDEAMAYAKELNVFVTICSDTFELVGKFGADAVTAGKLPDGYDYTWYKRRNPVA